MQYGHNIGFEQKVVKGNAIRNGSEIFLVERQKQLSKSCLMTFFSSCFECIKTSGNQNNKPDFGSGGMVMNHSPNSGIECWASWPWLTTTTPPG